MRPRSGTRSYDSLTKDAGAKRRRPAGAAPTAVLEHRAGGREDEATKRTARRPAICGRAAKVEEAQVKIQAEATADGGGSGRIGLDG